MKTTNQLTGSKESNRFFSLQNDRLINTEMLVIKGGKADEDPPQGDDDQEDGFN